MSTKRKLRLSRNERAKPLANSVLKQFECSQASYDFFLPLDTFDSKAFLKKTGIKSNHWSVSAVLMPKDRTSRYHVHFKGEREPKSERVHFKIDYFDRAHKTAKDETEPFAESVMKWLGQFVREPISRAVADVQFNKSNDKWKSRFNLPFRVTMADREVTIDGVSLDLPKNDFRALEAFVARSDKELYASVRLIRTVEFEKFNIAEEIAYFNEAIKIFMEPVL